MKLLYFSRWLRVFLACACLALAACGARVDLMGAVPEDEANEVLSALLKADIAAKGASCRAVALLAVGFCVVGSVLTR